MGSGAIANDMMVSMLQPVAYEFRLPDVAAAVVSTPETSTYDDDEKTPAALSGWASAGFMASGRNTYALISSV